MIFLWTDNIQGIFSFITCDRSNLISPLITIAGLIAVFIPFTLLNEKRLGPLSWKLRQKNQLNYIKFIQLLIPSVNILPWIGVCCSLIYLACGGNWVLWGAFLIILLSCLLTLVLLCISAVISKETMEHSIEQTENEMRNYHKRDMK